MLKTLMTRMVQGYRTSAFPAVEPQLSDRFRGLPVLKPELCGEECRGCLDSCPTGAIARNGGLSVDLGRCLFCAECQAACPSGAIAFSGDYRLAVRERSALEFHGEVLTLARRLEAKMLKLFGRSLKLRQVSAAGCNGCEVDVNVLNTLVYDLGRFGIQFVASPRHADGLLVTGPVSENMRVALLKTYEAIPEPKLVIASGACAISGGPFAGNPEVHHGAAEFVPVDLFVPGCPPHPYTLLDGLLRLLDQREERA